MTREEAIKHGKEQLEIFGGEHREFIEMSIKALEQEPTLLSSELEKNSKKLEKDFGELDCISRADLIERINNAEEQFKYDNMETIGSDDGDPFVDGVLSGVWNIREMVKQAPSVTPQEPVLDKLRAEIERQEKWLMVAGYNQYNVDIALDTIKSVVDKCKAEGRDKE